MVPGSMAAISNVSMLITHWLCTSRRAGRSLGCRINKFFSKAFLQAEIFLNSKEREKEGRGGGEEGG